MKGVSAVIATILMLIITIALAALAYGFMQGVFVTETQGIRIMEVWCVQAVADTMGVQFRNIGTEIIAANTITWRQTSPQADTSSGTLVHAQMESQAVIVINNFDTCTGTGARSCAYVFTPPIGQQASGSDICT